MKPREAASVVRHVEAAWDTRFSRERAVMWTEGMEDLDYEDTMAALRSLVKSRATVPSVAALRKEVARRAGLLPPPLADALAQAEDWLHYQESLGFVNGSGWTPRMPEGIHPAVVRACGVVTGSGDMSYAFRSAYPEIADAFTNTILSQGYGAAVVGMLGDGS